MLEAHGLRVTRGGQPVNPNSVTWSAATIHQYDFVQPPGPQNVLGAVKFRFPNKHNVYMHDTPERNLFGGAYAPSVTAACACRIPSGSRRCC